MKKLTKKQKKTLLITGGILLFIVAVYFIFFFSWGSPSKKEEEKTNPPKKGSSATVITSPNWTNNTVFSNQSPMMKDERVSLIQSAYNYVAGKKGWDLISEDGIYGPETSEAMNRLMGKSNVSWKEVQLEHLKY